MRIQEPIIVYEKVAQACWNTVAPSTSVCSLKPDTGRRHGLVSADPARQKTLRSAQADSGAGVRHHQIGDGVPLRQLR
jgi:hypothetical protein